MYGSHVTNANIHIARNVQSRGNSNTANVKDLEMLKLLHEPSSSWDVLCRCALSIQICFIMNKINILVEWSALKPFTLAASQYIAIGSMGGGQRTNAKAAAAQDSGLWCNFAI